MSDPDLPRPSCGEPRRTSSRPARRAPGRHAADPYLPACSRSSRWRSRRPGAVAWLDLKRDSHGVAREAARRLAAAEARVTLARCARDWLAGELRDAQAKLALLEARLASRSPSRRRSKRCYRDLAARVP